MDRYRDKCGVKAKGRGMGMVSGLMVAAALLSGCAGDSGAGYRPIVDTGNPSYAPDVRSRLETDLSDCQQLAEQRSYFNGNRLEEMALGTAVGTGVGVASDRKWKAAGAGAGVGLAATGIMGALQTRDERQQIVVACLKGRGHPVVM